MEQARLEWSRFSQCCAESKRRKEKCRKCKGGVGGEPGRCIKSKKRRQNMSCKMAKWREERRQRREKKWGRKKKREIEEKKKEAKWNCKEKEECPAGQSDEVVGQQAAPGSGTRYFHPSWCHWLLLSSLVMLGDRIAGLVTCNNLLCPCLAQAKIFFPAPAGHGFICVSGCFWMAPISRHGEVVRGRAESGPSGTISSLRRWRPCSWPVFCRQPVCSSAVVLGNSHRTAFSLTLRMPCCFSVGSVIIF